MLGFAFNHSRFVGRWRHSSSRRSVDQWIGAPVIEYLHRAAFASSRPLRPQTYAAMITRLLGWQAHVNVTSVAPSPCSGQGRCLPKGYQPVDCYVCEFFMQAVGPVNLDIRGS